MSYRKQAKRTTIKDVAHAAGVSVTTVSNALNGRIDAMSKPTLDRIQEAIRTLNYRPSRVARSMVTRRTATIGLIIAEINTPLFLRAINIIEPIARSADYSILLCNAQNLKDEQQAVNLLLEKQVDGIIFLSTSTYIADDYLDRLPASTPPIVFINRSTGHSRFDQINWDNTAGVIKAIDYLVQHGHRHIAHLLGPKSRLSTDERLVGYRQGLAQNNLAFDKTLVETGDYEQNQTLWAESTLKLLSRTPRPTAIIASNDIVGAVVLRTVQQAGLCIPDNITVIGIDNRPFCTYLNPQLTTIELPVIDSGKLAINMLLERTSGQRKTAKQLTLPCPLILRESSGARP